MSDRVTGVSYAVASVLALLIAGPLLLYGSGDVRLIGGVGSFVGVVFLLAGIAMALGVEA